MKKTLFFAALVILFLAGPAGLFGLDAQSYKNEIPSFVENWTGDELDSLERGEIVIRNIKKCKAITLPRGLNRYTDEMIQSFEDIKANYLAEIIYKMPAEKNPGVMDQAVKIFEDIDLYKEIVYSDERKGESQMLFPEVEQQFRLDNPGLISIASRLRMDMLSEYTSILYIKTGPEGFYFSQMNTSNLKWHAITAVREKNMRAGIVCFEYGGFYYVYALGGIRAPRVPIIMSEIDRQFIGRIEDFTVFYIKRFNISR